MKVVIKSRQTLKILDPRVLVFYPIQQEHLGFFIQKSGQDEGDLTGGNHFKTACLRGGEKEC